MKTTFILVNRPRHDSDCMSYKLEFLLDFGQTYEIRADSVSLEVCVHTSLVLEVVLEIFLGNVLSPKDFAAADESVLGRRGVRATGRTPLPQTF